MIEIDLNRRYSSRELGELADDILREDSRTEMCRECGRRGQETGEVLWETYEDIRDGEGNPLVAGHPQFVCGHGHLWSMGEGSVRGIGGKDPILFEEHFQSRRRREIYNSLGAPDPSIVCGIYNRAHPQGRKINSPEARAKHGASYYR